MKIKSLVIFAVLLLASVKVFRFIKKRKIVKKNI